MIGLFDRDVFLKLCCCNLWDETLEVLKISEPFRLASTSSERSSAKVITKFLGGADPTETIERTAGTVRKVPVLSDEMVSGIKESAAYRELDAIDAGELLLTAILFNQPKNKMLLSGDKHFVSAFRDNFPASYD